MVIKKIKSANGVISVPGDKSISHRAVMLGALADGVTEITGFLNGADCLSTIDCFRSMGISIDTNGENVTVKGNGLRGLLKPDKMLYTGNSGTTTRLLCGILSAQSFDSSITGDKSIEKRPMKRVTKPLSLMGARIENDHCPLYIKGGPLKGIDYTMPVASAQVKTAVILAALYADGETIIREKEKSRDHTELMLRSMGAEIKSDGLNVSVRSVPSLSPLKVKIPGDISSAAFFMILGSILPNSHITIKNVGINPTRTGVLDILNTMGADITIENRRISAGEAAADITVRSAALKGTVVEGDIIPRLIDELPIIAVAAALSDGRTVIKDAGELKVKETNRIRAVTDELSKCGIDITETDDGMIINGGKAVHGADFKTYGDHRMAMSLSILAQAADGECTLDDASCVRISYPDFWDDLYKLG